MNKPRIVILGAGPAGLGAAYQLTRRGLADVTVLERNSQVGGNAGSFEVGGVDVDYGSHRLHPACDPEVLRDIQTLLGRDLLDRPRHGRIRLRERWIHFPLKPVDLALRLPPDFIIGVVSDSVKKLAAKGRASTNGHQESFASVMEAGLGQTICQDFYFPYARKIWGMAPDQLSATQAHRRVSAGSLTKLVRKALASVPGLKPKGSGQFYYPRHGFGQISKAFSQAAQEAGATLHLKATVQTVEITQDNHFNVYYNHDGRVAHIEADYVWSTIPITVLAASLKPAIAAEYLESASRVKYRAMILIYLVVEQDRFTEYDAHYFPESSIPITRLSEPKNYSAGRHPEGRTVLCAEFPTSINSPEWYLSDEKLGEMVLNALRKAGIPVTAPVSQVVVRRLSHAYPIYQEGYEKYFDKLDSRIDQIPGLLSFGRQGLFAHDNTHHALYMAYCAVNCLDESGVFDHRQWQEYRRIFETHVVED
jgi:protoporphyrinogen oxidase